MNQFTSPKSFVCDICHENSKSEIYESHEMYHGTRELFHFVECQSCKTIILLDPPENLSKFYENYYSFEQFPQQNNHIDLSNNAKLKRLIRRLRSNYFLSDKYSGLVPEFIQGRLEKVVNKPEVLSRYNNVLCELGLTTDSSILDIGCGSGSHLIGLYHEGFTNLTGVDPFLTDNQITLKELTITNKSLEKIDNKFDFIIMNHVFEHLPNPFETLDLCKKLLVQNGHLLIRMPTADSYAWKKYRGFWSGLHTPRHFYIYSVKSFRKLTKEFGFKLEDINFDSDIFQFWSSEQDKNGIAILDKEKSLLFNQNNLDKTIFTQSELNDFSLLAEQLNQAQQGDRCTYVLRKI